MRPPAIDQGLKKGPAAAPAHRVGTRKAIQDAGRWGSLAPSQEERSAPMKKFLTVALAAGALVVAACGGNSATTAPASAAASAAASASAEAPASESAGASESAAAGAGGLVGIAMPT